MSLSGEQAPVEMSERQSWTAHLPQPVRVVAHGWWKVFSFLFIGNYIAALMFAFLQGGWGALQKTLTTWGILGPLEHTNPLVFWITTGLLAALALAGLAEEITEQRTNQAQTARQKRTVEEARQTALSAQATAERALSAVTASATTTPPPQPLGPPDDAALLPVPTRFVGRWDDLAWVEERLRGDGADGADALVSIRGLAGIGKTALAGAATRQLQREGRFPDGVAVVFCQGLSDPADVLRRVLIRFDPLRRAPEATDLPHLQDTAKTVLHNKQALVVLDNIEPELPIGSVTMPLYAAGVALLLTSRQALPLSAVPAEASRALDLLTPQEALDIFASALGRADASALNPSERASAEHIVQALGYHTLAVHLAGAYAAAEGRDLATLASELSTPMGGLELASDESMPETVRRSFTHSLETLSPEAQRLFAGLAAFATPEFGRQAALALGSALGQARPESSLHTLMARALIGASTNGEMESASERERLRLHPLLWALAQEIYHGWPPSDQNFAALTVARYLATYAEAHQTDYAELAADEANLTGALEWAHAHDQPMLVADLAHGMRKFWEARGRNREAVDYLAWGVAAA